ncbi:uncharacterized protein M421DRAFT_301329 [Didymella exigua CBS 183.55]|uniref:RING-type domain-containing protein n=1 Tax=Didymella exigua CBS 183.55 TaxID=1150837 RepID=A0A6A5R6Z9_9PLEO|nr:uncharacterized protein M421DRAFT_301329 [Didymella exigua CBS 183.55]KAF1923925.1 hypothetical protein M421DRAFT_301329 [Didymella exigua CBS 183.55]
MGKIELITEAACLQLVLDVLPHFSANHVLAMIQERTTDLTRTKEHSGGIVNELLEGDTYPKEAETASKKRRQADSEDSSDYDQEEHRTGVLSYATDAIALLKDEFLNVPARHIENTLRQHKVLFKSYIALEEQLRTYQRITHAFVKPPRPRNKRGIELVLIEQGSRLPKELHAAKKRIEHEAARRRKVEQMKRAEELNLQRAKTNNEMGDCQCCFTEYPLNRMISCSSRDIHFFCRGCLKQYVETEIGQSKCRPVCFASLECKGTFSRAQLQQILDQKTFDRLEHLQQQEDLAAAGLDFLSECPFCDFKAECPPIEVDREFRCQNTKCGKTSCRLCDKETHIPLSCEEAKKGDQITLRHIVEEAMSAALIRKCNKCQQPFIKDYGCNKMSCSHCGNKQCYICSMNVINYEHFGNPNKGRCNLHDNVEDVHEQAVKRAADEAMAKVRVENPELSEADLMVQVSDRVKKAEAARKGRAAERLNEFPYEMLGDQLAHRPGYPIIPPPRGIVAEEPRALGRPGAAVGAAYNGLAAAVGLPADPAANEPLRAAQLAQLRAQALFVAQQNDTMRMHQQFQDYLNPLAPIDQGFQAAQIRFQQQLRRANMRAHNAYRGLNAQTVQAEMDILDAHRETRRRRLQDVQQRFGELERLGRPLLGPQQLGQPALSANNSVPGDWPAFGLGGQLANAGHAEAGVGLRGMAFDGLDANRAIRNWEMHNRLDEQPRNVPRQ